MSPSTQEVRDALKPLLLKDLRVNLRARSVNPAGSRDALMERLYDNMVETQNFDLTCVDGSISHLGCGDQNQPPVGQGIPPANLNNFHRPNGQNTGNFITDRPSSRIVNHPGGASQVVFGDEGTPPAFKKYNPAPTVTVNAGGAPPAKTAVYDVPPTSQGGNSLSGFGDETSHSNNYHRPGGQNVGNFLTNRNSSRVLAPPGGASQVTFG